VLSDDVMSVELERVCSSSFLDSFANTTNFTVQVVWGLPEYPLSSGT
jgi:hypothetical protein